MSTFEKLHFLRKISDPPPQLFEEEQVALRGSHLVETLGQYSTYGVTLIFGQVRVKLCPL